MVNKQLIIRYKNRAYGLRGKVGKHKLLGLNKRRDARLVAARVSLGGILQEDEQGSKGCYLLVVRTKGASISLCLLSSSSSPCVWFFVCPPLLMLFSLAHQQI